MTGDNNNQLWDYENEGVILKYRGFTSFRFTLIDERYRAMMINNYIFTEWTIRKMDTNLKKRVITKLVSKAS